MIDGQMDRWVDLSTDRCADLRFSSFDGETLPPRFAPSITVVSLSRLLARNQLLQADMNWLLLSTAWKPSEERVPRKS